MVGMSTQASTSPTEQDTVDQLCQDLAAGVLALRGIVARLVAASPDAAASATVLGLLEQIHRTVTFGQFVAIYDADLAEVHRLDPATAQLIDGLVANPYSLADGSARVPASRMCKGMAPHRTTAAYAQAHLHISVAETKRRAAGARLLVAPAPTADPRAPQMPLYPVLAVAAADGTADVGNLAQLADRLEGLKPRIAPRPDAQNLTTAIEESLVREARHGEPKDCGKAFQDWKAFLAENGSPITDQEILARRGMYYQGFKDGSDVFMLRCDPMDSEVLRAFMEAWTNPRSGKLPPASRSTTPTPVPCSPVPRPVDSPIPDSESQPIADVGDSQNPGTPLYSPVGIPAPAWAVAPGTTQEQMPLSELDCGLPPDVTPEDLVEMATVDPRTPPQLLLDAVIAACAGVLSGADVSETGGMHVKIGVLIGYQSLLGQLDDAGITAHGRPISAANIRRMACNADLLPAVLGANGELLDLGRESRGFNKAQRRALALRDRGCTVPGCHRSAATSEAHHVTSWLEGGETSIQNGALLCQYHHTMVHAGLITLKMIDGVPYCTGRAGQPRGDPERNLYWHPELRTAGYTAPLFTD